MSDKVTAASTIKPGGNNVDWVFESGNTEDIIVVIMHADKESAKYTSAFAETFDGSTIEICEDLYFFVQNNIEYKEDPAGVQLIKSPAQLYSDGVGDCKSFSLFIGSVLKNLNIPFVYRFVSFKPGDVTHVYVVAYDDDGSEIYLDAVPPMNFNEEHPDIVRKIDKSPAGLTVGSKGNNSHVSGATVPGTSELPAFLILIGLAVLMK